MCCEYRQRILAINSTAGIVLVMGNYQFKEKNFTTAEWILGRSLVRVVAFQIKWTSLEGFPFEEGIYFNCKMYTVAMC